MSKIEELIKKHCPCLPAGRPMVWNINDFPLKNNCWYVYVLLCDNGMLYKGFTDNPIRRFNEHRRGYGAKYTQQHKPIALIYYEEYDSEQAAVMSEKKIKSGMGREKLKKHLASTLKLDVYE